MANLTNKLDTTKVTYTAREIKYINEDLEHGRDILTKLIQSKEAKIAFIRSTTLIRKDLTDLGLNQIDILEDQIHELERARRDMKMASDELLSKLKAEGPSS